MRRAVLAALTSQDASDVLLQLSSENGLKRMGEMLDYSFALEPNLPRNYASFQAVAVPLLTLLTQDWFCNTVHVQSVQLVLGTVHAHVRFLPAMVKLATRMCESPSSFEHSIRLPENDDVRWVPKVWTEVLKPLSTLLYLLMSRVRGADTTKGMVDMLMDLRNCANAMMGVKAPKKDLRALDVALDHAERLVQATTKQKQLV